MALLKFFFCFVLYCYAFVQYCYLKSIQYNAMHKFVGVLDNPPANADCELGCFAPMKIKLLLV